MVSTGLARWWRRWRRAALWRRKCAWEREEQRRADRGDYRMPGGDVLHRDRRAQLAALMAEARALDSSADVRPTPRGFDIWVSGRWVRAARQWR